MITRVPAAMMPWSLIINGRRSIESLARVLLEAALSSDCPVCVEPMGRHMGGVCLSCWDEVTASDNAIQRRPDRYIESLTTIGPYEGRLRAIIRCLKFSDLPGLGEFLAERIAGRLPIDAKQADIIVPVPLHGWRRWRRGYNQAERIAVTLRPSLGIPVAPGLLVRSRATAAQSGRSRPERLANVRGAFRASAGLRGLRVLLVDDVVTTGATLRECARTLKAAGVRSVHAAAAARTLSRLNS